jgi:cation diffusion facilitator CzcD-associated flavoprotein CzcO
MGSINHCEAKGDADYFDIIVVGGGFGGCKSLHTFRQLGFSVHLFEAGSALGGVWHWNSYPGARVDSEMPYYQLFIPEVYRNWNWTERFPGHAELKKYFEHVDKTLGLSKDISYNTVVIGADFDIKTSRWTVTTNAGRVVKCKYFVPATGSSYKVYQPDFPKIGDFQGIIVHSAAWPKDGIDFKGKKVAIIGAGASGVQCVQEISKVADKLTVYIRNPNLGIPMHQRQLTDIEQRAQKSIYQGLFKLSQETGAGLAADQQTLASTDASPAEREELWEELWQRGGFNFQASNYRDFLVDAKANRLLYDFWAKKVRERIKSPEKQAILAPAEPPYPFATKRSSLEQDYYDYLDQDHVEVVGLKTTPIKEFTHQGIATDDGNERLHDIIVLATGFDNMTGSLFNMGLRGKDGVDMKKRWEGGVRTYLGLMANGCPNMFMIYGPQGKLIPVAKFFDCNANSLFDKLQLRLRTLLCLLKCKSSWLLTSS